MRKPKHPKNSWHEPKKIYIKEGRINFSDLNDRSLISINEAWVAAVIAHVKQGHTITKEPTVYCGDEFGDESCLVYSYSYINNDYESDKRLWDERLEKYKEELSEYDNFMLKKYKNRYEPKDIDEKILRTEQRLANLKAAKAGEDIPFPDNYD